MKYHKRFRLKSLTKPEYRGYNATYKDVLQDRIRHLKDFERPTFYNKYSDPDRRNNK